jgi:hypothetical protein
MVGQASIPPTPTGTTLAGQTVLITGGNTGLGFETARQYLTLQATRVIITVRSESKGQEAISLLRADPAVQAANPSAKIDFFLLDLDDYQSGLRFCQKVKLEVPELDILLCNAGMNIMRFKAAKSGHEKVMQGKLQPGTTFCSLADSFEISQLLHPLPHRFLPPPPSSFHIPEAQFPLPSHIRRFQHPNNAHLHL